MFVVNEFHLFYKETMEGVWHKGVSHLLQRVEMKDICHEGFSRLLQGELHGRCVLKGSHICYKEVGNGSCLL